MLPSTLATLMLDGFLSFMNHSEVTLVFSHYGLTFSEQDLNTSLCRRPVKVSGVSRVSHLYFCLEDCSRGQDRCKMSEVNY
jgi:hypothetical protein